MAVPVLTTPAFIGPAGGPGLLSGLESGAGAAGVAAVGAGLVGLGLAAVAIPLLAAPAGGALAVGSTAASALLVAGTVAQFVKQLVEWGFYNWKPEQEGPRDPLEDEELVLNNGVDALVTIKIDRYVNSLGSYSCSNGAENFGPSVGFQPNFINTFSYGSRVVLKRSRITDRISCGVGDSTDQGSVPLLEIYLANGSLNGQIMVQGNTSSFHPFNRQGNDFAYANVRLGVGGVETPWQITVPRGEPVLPQLFPQPLPDAPVLPAPAPATPLETPVLPPPPNRRPLAPPVTIPRPGQQPARVPVPGPRPGPSPGPGPSPTPSQPAPAGVPAIGPLPLPIPLPVPTTPGSVVIVDGQPIGGPGQAPAPNLVAMAQELGRLERKNEILLSRPENGGLGEVAENAILGTLRSLLERLVTELLNDVPAGSFSLSHACPPPGGSDPLPPVVVPYGGGGNPTAGILARLDGLAGLIQAHKSMGQPTCKTAVSGEEVTIHFESDS